MPRYSVVAHQRVQDFLTELRDEPVKERIRESIRKLADYPLSLRELDVEKSNVAEQLHDFQETMTVEKLETYERLSARYMDDAQGLLEKGDTVQAGEKLWGSVAEAVKATATKRGLSLRTKADIWNFVLRLDREYPKKEFYTLFIIADHLHSNFYEDELPAAAVTKALPKLKEFTLKLKEL